MSSSDKRPTTTRLMQPPATALLIYPVTLVVGSLFSVLSPTAQGSRDHALYGTAGGPLTPATPVNYFARKDNVFNLYFVKVGWLWTTLAFAVVLLSLDAYRTPSSQRLRRMGQATARYALATLVWYLTTQWCFGPAIIDRSFVVTGGRCEHMVPSVGGSGSNHDDDDPFGFHSLFTAAACKSAGGAWRGGHDVSGHVFMLVLTTSMLGFETVGALGAGDEESGRRKWSVRFVSVVAALSWWMLLMTAIWFHTWFEKFNGLLIALGTVYTIYILPRRVIPWRNVVGIPGL